MAMSTDDQAVAGHLIGLALTNFGVMSRDGDHDRFCWFLDRLIKFSKKRILKTNKA